MVKGRGVCEAFDQEKKEGGEEAARNIIYTFSKKKNELMVVQRPVQLVCDV